MFKVYVAALASVALLLVAGPAFAAVGPIDGRVSFEWGDLLSSFLYDNAQGFAVAITGLILHFAPGGSGSIIRMLRINQLIEFAVKSAINKTAGAVQGKALSADVGNEVLERALEYAKAQAPKLFKQLPIQEWKEKIIARMTLSENVAIDGALRGFVDPKRA